MITTRRADIRLLVLPIAALLAALLLVLPAGAESKQGKNFWGVHVFEPAGAKDYAAMKKAGVGIVRAQIFWGLIEASPPNADGSRNYNWAGIDALMGLASNSNMPIHGALYGTPSWLANDQAVAPIYSQRGRDAWRAFTRAVVNRYSRDGVFWKLHPELKVNPIRTYQIWNEQNSSARYKPAPDPQGYALLLELASKQIRAVDKRAEVMLGGMFGTPGVTGSIDAWDFLDKSYKIDGFKKSFDTVAAHPYSPDLRGVKYQMDEFRKALVRNGARNTPVAVTEIGWASGKPRETNFFYQGIRGQAKLLGKAFKLFLKNEDKWNLKRILWHAWRDPSKPIFRCGACDSLGLVDKKLKPKPAYATYKKYAK